MTEHGRHIIHRVNLNINMQSEEEAFELRNNISSFLQNYLLPSVENYFNSLNINGEIVRFDEVQLNVQVEDIQDVAEIKDKIISELQVKLDRYHFTTTASDSIHLPTTFIESSAVKTISIQSNLEQLFLYFLKKGVLPWHAPENAIVDFAKEEMFKKVLLLLNLLIV